MRCLLFEKKNSKGKIFTHSFKVINDIKRIKKRDVLTLKKALDLENTCLDSMSLKKHFRYTE